MALEVAAACAAVGARAVVARLPWLVGVGSALAPPHGLSRDVVSRVRALRCRCRGIEAAASASKGCLPARRPLTY